MAVSRTFVQYGVRVVLALVATPIVLFLTVALLLYLPPVQQWAVGKACAWAERETGYKVSVGYVRLAFPLHLVMEDVAAADAEGDTLLATQTLDLDVAALPLLEGRVDVEGFAVGTGYVNTKSLISDVHVQGHVGLLSADTHGYRWQDNALDKLRARLDDADLCIVLTDTAASDTTPSAPWNIGLTEARIKHSRVRLQLPGDTLTVDAGIETMLARQGQFDTGHDHYTLSPVELSLSHLRYSDYNIPAADLKLDSLAYIRETLTVAGRVRTEYSELQAELMMPMAALERGRTEQLRLGLSGQLHTLDVRAVAERYVPQEYRAYLPNEAADLSLKVGGNLSHLLLDECSLSLSSLAELHAHGVLNDIESPQRSGQLWLGVTTRTGANRLVQHMVGSTVQVPAGSRLAGNLAFSADTYRPDLVLYSHGGTAHLNGRVTLHNESYNLGVAARGFDVRDFVPSLPLSPLTAKLQAAGHGFDPVALKSRLQFQGSIQECRYEQYPLSETRLKGQLAGARGLLQFDMRNDMLQGNGHLRADLARGYAVDADLCIDDFYPHAVGLMKDTLMVGGRFVGTFSASADLQTLKSQGTVEGLTFISRDTIVNARTLDYEVALLPHTTYGRLASGDLSLQLDVDEQLQTAISRAQQFVDTLTQQVQNHDIRETALSRLLPHLTLDLQAGDHNPLSQLMHMQGYEMTRLDSHLEADSLNGLMGWARVGRLGIGKLQLDTIYADLLQDSTGLKLLALIDNNHKTNPNRFVATIDGYMLSSGAGASLVFRDEHNKTGIDLGIQAEFQDDGMSLHFYPETPIIAYRRFTINPDNYIRLGNDSTVRAQVDLLADDGTGLKIYGEPVEGHNDITLSINRLNLGELSSVLTWLPPVKGYLSGDFHMSDADDVLSAMASTEFTNFSYDGVDIGTLGLEATYLPKADNEHYAEMLLIYDDTEVAQARGSYYNRGEGAFVGDVTLNDLPLSLTDAFTSGLGVGMTGHAVGSFHAEGPISQPVINGALNFEDAHILSHTYGVDFRLADTPVPVVDNHLRFEDFELFSTGQNPFCIDGDINAENLAEISLNLKMNTRNFELINAPKNRESLVYGKVYTDFDATIRGTLSALTVRGNLNVLDRTDVTYVLKDTPLSVEDEFADLVTFTNFRDTLQQQTPESASTDIDLHMNINVSDAARFHCLLSQDGSSYVDVMGGGNLAFRYNHQGDMTVTGRFAIQDGEMKYELPVIPLKTFHITPGSYVEFTGDILNPHLNIAATENTKATVADGDQKRSVLFVVGVLITQTLNDMGLEFTLEAPEDLSVQNDLATMSAIQLNKTAVALLATGLYMTDDFSSVSSGFKGSNALNMFLQSSIQGIAGNALSTVDFNFDIDNSTTSTGGRTTDYNFEFAKRFWGDRISVILGGKVSTGAEANNTAASIIDNISVEYRLDKGATRYVRVFYDRTSHDALEGKQTETGAGLVLRRKTNRLGELFLFRSPKNND